LRIGLHLHNQGSFEKTARKAAEIGANTLQIFTSSPRMWRQSRPAPEDVALFLRARAELDLHPLVIHDNYLINLAAPEGETRRRSIEAFRGEALRALLFEADYLVTHPGSFREISLVEALRNVVEGLEEALDGLPPGRLTVLLENTAGQGAALGYRFEELAAIREYAAPRIPFPLAYCLDTAHCLAAGYDVSSPEAVEATLEEAGRLLDLGRVRVIHANDSKAPLGSRRDRHENIGKGYIGTEGFRALVNDRRLRDKAFICETPAEEDGDNRRDVARLRTLCEPAA
jgi:deoxyribonuclease IV